MKRDVVIITLLVISVCVTFYLLATLHTDKAYLVDILLFLISYLLGMQVRIFKEKYEKEKN